METANALTCITCQIKFLDRELHKVHFRSDWHRYNLHCKVSGIDPVTAEEYQQRLINKKLAEEEANQEKTWLCESCKKSFKNENAYENHLGSKKHKENMTNPTRSSSKSESEENTNSGKDLSANIIDELVFEDDVEEIDSDEWDEETENPVEYNNCIFCLHHSRNFQKNLEHMTTKHSFFIPDIEYCVDVEGLLSYLGQKISGDFMCIWCNEKGRTFHSSEAARNHMMDKGHCRMLYEGIALMEYSDFYDYSTSYPDAENNADIDEIVPVEEIDGSDYQLVLPSGITVGHRSLMRYYKQRLKPESAVVVKKNDRKLHKDLAHYKALGWTDTDQKAAAKRAKDVHYMKRLQTKLNMKLGVKANKLQTHFRQQVNF